MLLSVVAELDGVQSHSQDRVSIRRRWLRRGAGLVAAIVAGVALSWWTRPGRPLKVYALQTPEDVATGLDLRKSPGLRGAERPGGAPGEFVDAVRVRILSASTGEAVPAAQYALLAQGVSPDLAGESNVLLGAGKPTAGVFTLALAEFADRPLPRTYMVFAPNYSPTALEIVEADLARTEPLELRLAPLGRSVQGTVRDSQGAPVAGVVVWAAAAASARNASSGAVTGVTPGVYSTRSDADGRFEIACAERRVALHVRDVEWVDFASLKGRIRGGIFHLWQQSWGTMATAGGPEAELIVVRPHFLAVRLVDQWGDPVQAVTSVTLTHPQFGLTNVPIRAEGGWLAARVWGGQPDGTIIAVLSPRDHHVPEPAARLPLQIAAHGYETTYANVSIRRATASDPVAVAQTVVVKRTSESRGSPLTAVVERTLPKGCPPSDSCKLSYKDSRGEPHQVSGMRIGPAGALSRWKYFGLPEDVKEVQFRDGFGVSALIQVPHAYGAGNTVTVTMPAPTGVFVRVSASGGQDLHKFELATTTPPGRKKMTIFPTGGGVASERMVTMGEWVMAIWPAPSGMGLYAQPEQVLGRDRFFPLTPSSHQLRIRAVGFRPLDLKVELSPGEVRTLEVVMHLQE